MIKLPSNAFRLFREEAGVISKEKCWVCVCEGYLYTADTLEDLIQVLNIEWKQDKWLA